MFSSLIQAHNSLSTPTQSFFRSGLLPLKSTMYVPLHAELIFKLTEVISNFFENLAAGSKFILHFGGETHSNKISTILLH